MNQTQLLRELAAHLAAGGLEQVVVSPGARNAPVLMALAAQPGVELFSVLDERGAGFFALGLARASAKPVGLLCTSGSAGAHYLPALIEASSSALPLIVLTADRPPELRGSGAWQTIEQRGLFGGQCRLSEELVMPRRGLPSAYPGQLAARLLDAALCAPAGPVHLNLPCEEPLLPEAAVPSLSRACAPRRNALRPARRLEEWQLDQLAARLHGQAKGVVVAGGFASPRPAFARLAEALAGRLGWPLLAEAGSGLRAGPQAACLHYDALLRDGVFASEHPRLALRFGQTPSSKPLLHWLAGCPASLCVDPQGLLHCPDLQCEQLVVSEPEPLIESLLERLPRPPQARPWLERWQRAEAHAVETLATFGRDRLWEGEVARSLLESLPAGSGLHVANSMPIRDLNGFAGRVAQTVTIFTQRGVNGIDGTVSSAVGESLHQGGPFALLCGDLAFLHDAAGLLIARQTRARLSIVVLNNGGGGIFGFLPMAEHSLFERHFLTPQQVDLGALCAAYGVAWTRVESIDGLRAHLSGSLNERRLEVIEVPIDRAANLALHRQAWEAVQQSLQPVLTGAAP